MPSMHRPHILVVDDEPCVREALTAALHPTYVGHAAATGTEALACLRTQPIAAIFLDAVLENEHGLDLVERFRALSSAKILMLTGYGSEELAVRALRAKVDDYLKKPPNPEQLRGALDRLVALAPRGADPVAQVRAYLDQHREKEFRPEDLAGQLGWSEAHWRRRFREVLGKTPRRYLTEVRLTRAAEQLRTTRLTIEQIAQSVGYPEVRRFSRLFKCRFGVSPSDFRAGPDREL